MLVLAGVVAAVVAAAVQRRRATVGIAASWTLMGAVAILAPWLPLDTGTPVGGSVTVAVANVLMDNRDPLAAAEDIIAVDADVVVVPEANDVVHGALAGAYPFAHRPGRFGTRTGVYARVPARVLPEIPGLFDDDRYSRVRIAGDEPFVLWALHLPRPWLVQGRSHQMRPRRHARTVDAVADAIEREDLPVVVAGDLNLTDRGRGYRRMTAHLDDAMRSISGRRTSLKPLFRPLLLRIDHILEPEDWCADQARRFGITGSDHRGVAARVGPCSRR